MFTFGATTLKKSHTLFISDLHLGPDSPNTAQAFFKFLEQQAPQADALYILGDFFDVWLGDDDDTDFTKSIKVHLTALTSKGFPVYFMHGNRDVLIGKRFLKETGCTLLEEPTVIDLYGVPTLIMHGDSLCVDDTLHRVFRYLSRCALMQKIVLAVPLRYRQLFLKWLRKKSQSRVRQLDEKKLDVNQEAVSQIMQEVGVAQMIHGHTHKPAVHAVQRQQGKPLGQRFVLGAWEDTIYALVYSSDGRHYVLSNAC